MLPSFNDCARAAVAKSYSRVVTAHGFEIAERRPSIGAAVGTAIHKAVEIPLRRLAGETVEGDGLDIAMAAFGKEVEPGCEWDATTKTMPEARRQIEEMSAAYIQSMNTRPKPRFVEMKLDARIHPGWVLTGTIDLVTVDGVIDDLKTGSIKRPYQAQLGAYGILFDSQGSLGESTALQTTWMKRVRGSKGFSPSGIQTIPYDKDVSESYAWATLERVAETVDKFSASGNPDDIPANPMSLMCSPRYCPAYGTSFCKVHNPAPSMEDAG